MEEDEDTVKGVSAEDSKNESEECKNDEATIKYGDKMVKKKSDVAAMDDDEVLEGKRKEEVRTLI